MSRAWLSSLAIAETCLLACLAGGLAEGKALASGCGTKPSQGAHVTAVCLGGGSCRGQCKGVTPEQAGARRKPPISAGGSLGVASAGLPLDCRDQYKATLSLPLRRNERVKGLRAGMDTERTGPH